MRTPETIRVHRSAVPRRGFVSTRPSPPTYLQLVQQVRQAVRLGILHPGDQLPTVKDVVAALTLNPNTVLRAYRELDLAAIVEGRRGVGTFAAADLEPLPADDVKDLRASLRRCAAGLDGDDLATLFADTVRPPISPVA